MKTPDTKDFIDFLDAQCDDFQQLQGLGRRQRECLQRDDLDGLEEAMTQTQALMVRVRVRQRDLGAPLTGEIKNQPEIASRLERLRCLLESIAKTRVHSEAAARRLLDQTRQQMQQSNLQRRAKHGYARAGKLSEPRFTDGLR